MSGSKLVLLAITSACILNSGVGVSSEPYLVHQVNADLERYYISSENSSCPLWFLQVPNSTVCRCSSNIDRQIICSSSGSLPRKLYVMVGYCMTWEESKGIPVLARCPFHYFDYSEMVDGYLPTDPNLQGENLTEFMCSHFDRKGSLCSSCKEEHGPAPFSKGMKCGKCKGSYKWLYYLLVQLILLTAMFLLCTIFMIHLTKSPMNALVFYWQIFVVTLNFDALLYGFLASYIKLVYVQVVLSFYAIWNLDFFQYSIPPLCVTSSMNNIDALLFDYIVALYPILLTVVSYVVIDLYDRKVRLVIFLWRPFRCCFACCKKTWNPKASIVKTFATFLTLSYTKVLFTSANLLYHTPVYDHDGKLIPPFNVLYYDAKIAHFSKEHAPYIVVGCTCLTLALVPPLLLLLYPTHIFKRLLEKCGFQRWPMLHIFMDTFQGWYKDGTQGSRDYRWVSALYLLFRLAFLGLCSAVTVSKNTSQLFWVLPGIIFILTAMFFTIAQPYKIKWMNNIDGMIMALLGILFFTFYQFFDVLVFQILMVVSNMPLLLCILYGMHRLANHYNVYTRLRNKLKAVFKSGRSASQSEDTLPESLPYRAIHPNSYHQDSVQPTELKNVDDPSTHFNTYGTYGSTGSTQQS